MGKQYSQMMKQSEHFNHSRKLLILDTPFISLNPKEKTEIIWLRDWWYTDNNLTSILLKLFLIVPLRKVCISISTSKIRKKKAQLN